MKGAASFRKGKCERFHDWVLGYVQIVNDSEHYLLARASSLPFVPARYFFMIFGAISGLSSQTKVALQKYSVIIAYNLFPISAHVLFPIWLGVVGHVGK